MAPMNMNEEGYEVHTTQVEYPTQGAEVMQTNSTSDLARLGYAHGMWGIEREYPASATYMGGYTEGEAEWSRCIARARGKA